MKLVFRCDDVRRVRPKLKRILVWSKEYICPVSHERYTDISLNLTKHYQQPYYNPRPSHH